ncbi:hypothetical protein M0804_001722 [Polistes exclamans]|nr:hypothetical protein M0804_001722 [Polistes exclamans]
MVWYGMVRYGTVWYGIVWDRVKKATGHQILPNCPRECYKYAWCSRLMRLTTLPQFSRTRNSGIQSRHHRRR